jgi:hypothetical protein
MNMSTNRLPTASKLLLPLVLMLGALVFAGLGATADRASAYWVCNPTSPVTRGPDFRCLHGTYRPTIAYVQKDSSPRAYAVYRSSVYGGGSVSGTEFYSPTSDYFLQDFYCNPGYPAAHNRHTVNVAVQYTLAASC